MSKIEETRSSLILEARVGGAPEERADLPPAHAQSLLAVSQGRLEYVRTSLSVGAHEIQVLQFVRPDALDLVRVTIAPGDEQEFRLLPWFGPEVSADPAYEHRRLALEGCPDAPEVELTDAALNSLLDLLEDRVAPGPLPQQAARAAGASPLADTPVPRSDTKADEEIEDPGIDDAIIRELARALQTQHGR